MNFQLRTIHPHTQPRLIAAPTQSPQDEPEPTPTPTKPTKRTTCPTCGKPFGKWGWCDPCRARLDRDIAKIAKKFPRETDGGCW